MGVSPDMNLANQMAVQLEGLNDWVLIKEEMFAYDSKHISHFIAV